MNVSLCFVHTAKCLRSFHTFYINLSILYIVLVIIYNNLFGFLLYGHIVELYLIFAPFEVRCVYVTCFG